MSAVFNLILTSMKKDFPNFGIKLQVKYFLRMRNCLKYLQQSMNLSSKLKQLTIRIYNFSNVWTNFSFLLKNHQQIVQLQTPEEVWTFVTLLTQKSNTKNSPGLINDNILIPLDTKPFMHNFNDTNTENVTNGPVQLLPGNKPCALSY